MGASDCPGGTGHSTGGKPVSAGASGVFCLPVLRQVDRFIPDRESASISGDLPELAAMRDYFSRHYRLVSAPVEINGATYICDVYEPSNIEDVSYALVDRNGIPESATALDVAISARMLDHFQNLRTSLAYSEGIPPQYRSYLPTEFIAPKFWELHPTSGTRTRTLTWLEFESHSRGIIIGDPGSGKTTCLRRLALDAAEESEHSGGARIPVYVQLRNADVDTNIMDLARKQVLAADPMGGQEFADLVDSGRLLLLLDGLDEVPHSLRDKITGSILHFARLHPTLGIFVTTRSTGYHWRFPGFFHVELQPFDKQDIVEWLTKRLHPFGKAVANRVISMLLTDPALSQIASNPLMLAMIARIIEREQAPASSRTALFNRYIELLVDEWDALRGIARSEFPTLNRDRKLEMLCRTAFKSYQTKQECFTTRDFIEWEREGVSDQLPEDAITTVWRHTGLWRHKHAGDESWIFSHEAVRSFLTAKYLVERTDNLLETFVPHFVGEGYTLIWVFACGLTQDASSLAKYMIEDADLPTHDRAILLGDTLMQGVNLTRNTFELSCNFIRENLEQLVSRFDVERTSEKPFLSDMKNIPAAHSITKLLEALASGVPSTPRHAEIARIFSRSADPRVVRWGSLIMNGTLGEELRLILPKTE